MRSLCNYSLHIYVFTLQTMHPLQLKQCEIHWKYCTCVSFRIQLMPCFFLSPIQFISFAQSCPTLCNPTDCSTPGFPVHNQLLELVQTHVHWVGDAMQPLILCHPLLLLSSIFPSIRVSSNESVLSIRWPKVLEL